MVRIDFAESWSWIRSIIVPILTFFICLSYFVAFGDQNSLTVVIVVGIAVTIAVQLVDYCLARFK